jgi:chloramphenicol O-acetyltransferase type A
MKEYLDIDTWDRKEVFQYFRTLADPTFSVVVDVDVTKTYQLVGKTRSSFFVKYLYACMKAINSVENLKYRIEDNKIAVYDVINASATIARADTTYGFSFIDFSENFTVFNENFKKEKKRIQNSTNLFPQIKSLDCIYCSVLPWISFTSHKEPNSGNKDDSVPRLAFGGVKEKKGKILMPVSINVNHALVDGYHVGQFFKKFQLELDKLN